MKKRQANFHRTKFYAYVKLGKRQKSLRKYKRSGGRHNKTRQKWRSRPPMVEIGYKNQCSTRGLVNGKMPILVYNLEDLKKATKENIVIIGKIGMKNKIEIAKEALAKNTEVYNLNLKKFIKDTEKVNKKPEVKEAKK
jgi:large subunit ribosomal protein L32e